MRWSRASLTGLVTLSLLAAPAARAGDEKGLEYESIGTLECFKKETGSWWRTGTWWVFLFSGSYSTCHFLRSDGKMETYRGRSGIEFGADLMPEPLVLNVLGVKTAHERKLGPHALDGKFKSDAAKLRRGKQVVLESENQEFKLELKLDEARGVAFGIAYLKLEKPEDDDKADGGD